MGEKELNLQYDDIDPEIPWRTARSVRICTCKISNILTQLENNSQFILPTYFNYCGDPRSLISISMESKVQRRSNVRYEVYKFINSSRNEFIEKLKAYDTSSQ